MCGIAGACGWADRRHAEAVVLEMSAALARRGPDSDGLESFDSAVLGHRRLSIYDLSEAGHQPMVTPDRSVAVVFNGAVYNFPELRAELARAGYVFRSHTDTEVLLHGYAEWGIDRLASRLRGMFAFGLWDDRARTLFLVRDRLGVKPLYYAVRGDEIAFASTASALARSGLTGDIDADAVAEYLEFGYVTDSRCIYAGAHKLPAATILEFRSGKMAVRQYWRLPDAAQRGPSFSDAVEETERLLLEAVKLRLDADVPVGALLSGGIDSTLVCWAMSRLGADIKAFTVGTRGDPLDESADAAATAAQLGLRHEVVDLVPGDTPAVAELAAAYGEPFACSSALGMLRVSRSVRKCATVLLTGDGGDDVFLGYPEHRHFQSAQQLARMLPGLVVPLWRQARTAFPRHGVLRRAAHFVDYATGGLGAVTRAKPGLDVCAAGGMLGDRLRQCQIAQRSIPLSHDSGRRLLTEFLAYDRETRFPGEYMTKVDGATMYYALEARSPFLDHVLWEFAAGLPYAVRLQRGTLKAVLREIARRRVGARIADGRKRGFGIPATRWMITRWREEFEDIMARSVLEREGWIVGAQVRKAFQQAVERGEAPLQLWYIYVLETWLRTQLQTVADEPKSRVQAGT